MSGDVINEIIENGSSGGEKERSEKREEAFAWGRLKGALVRKYPEIRKWLEERERSSGGFKNLVEELLYTQYLRERFGIRGMTLHDVVTALDVAGDIIDKARDVFTRLKDLEEVSKMSYGEEDIHRGGSESVRTELAKAFVELVKAVSSMLSIAVQSASAMAGVVKQQPVQSGGDGKNIDVDKVINDVQKNVNRK